MQGPRASVAVIVVDEDYNLLLAERIAAHEGGKHGCPGGKVDFLETPEAAAIREIKEETGLTLNVEPVPLIANCHYPHEGNHFVCLWFKARMPGVRPDVPFIELNAEGNPKTFGWKWHSSKELRSVPLMYSTLYAYDKVVSANDRYELLNIGPEGLF
jgi:ADP-ribose pyrophosphatase YjhB (NUDIX family)